MSNYELEHKLEHVYTLRNLATLVREPVNLKNYQKMLDTQQRKIHELMVAAYEIPFYRARFEQSGTTPDDYHNAQDLYKFPLLTKDELREWMDHEAQSDPEKYKYWHVSPTSGSTGKPLRVLVSPKENAWATANWLRVLSLPGFNPFTGKTMCRPNSLHGPVKPTDSPVQKLGILRRHYMSDTIKMRVDTQTLIDEINAYEPGYLYNHKNVLVRIAKYVKENNVYLWKPDFYTPFGEMMDEPSRQLLTEVFGPGLVDAYGMSEVGSCAVRIPSKRYYQINSDTHVVNIYSRDLKEPAMKGPAVITPLWKTELPIINYISGDSMDTYFRKGLRFARAVQGRSNDIIHHRDGSVTEWGNVSGILNWVPEVVQYRMIQENYDDLTLLMVRNPDVPEEKQPEIEAFLTEKFDAMFKDSFNYIYKWVDEIPADPSGKLRLLISRLEPEQKKEDVDAAEIDTAEAAPAEAAPAEGAAPAEAAAAEHAEA